MIRSLLSNSTFAFSILLIVGNAVSSKSLAAEPTSLPLPCFDPQAVHLQALPGPAPQIIHSQQVTTSGFPISVWQLSPAQRDYEISRVRGILAERIDRERKQQKLESQIRLARAEVATFTRLQGEYAGFNRFSGGGNPFPVSESQMKLLRIAAEERLRALEWELGRFHQFGNLERYLWHLESVQAASMTALADPANR